MMCVCLIQGYSIVRRMNHNFQEKEMVGTGNHYAKWEMPGPGRQPSSFLSYAF